MLKRFHVYLGGNRTTVSLDHILAGVMALKLGKTPETSEAHSAVRKWLQARLDEANDPGRIHVSQWLQREAVLFVADKKLSDQYIEWLMESMETT